MPNTIGEYAQKKLEAYKVQLKNTDSKEELEALIKTIKLEFGDSVERVLLINDIIEKIEQR